MIQAKGPHLTLRLAESPKGRGGGTWMIKIPKRVVPLATKRNFWKRRIREVLRHQKVTIHPFYQLTLNVHNGSGPLAFRELEGEISQLLTKSGIVK